MVQALEEEVLGGRRVGRQESAARLEAMVVGWPALGELKRCAPRDSAAHRWSQALSALVAGARAVLDGALLAERARRPGLAVGEEVNLVVMVMAGATLYEDVSWLLQGGLRAHAGVWRMGTDRVREAEDRLALVVGRPAVFGGGEPPAWAQPVDEQGAPRPFPLAVLLFGAALRSDQVRAGRGVWRCACSPVLRLDGCVAAGTGLCRTGGGSCLLRGVGWQGSGWWASSPR